MEILAAIDPVTRLEGHLRVNITIDTVNGVQQVVEAQATGALFRGFENVLIGRDPRDAQHITERICGVCPVAHGMASVRALDSAFGITIPPNARIMRNLVNGANYVDSHLMHFYLLSAPDFLSGPPMPPWKPDWQVDRRFSKAQNDALVGHYVQAIEMRRKAHEMGALFGGRLPHPPAYIPGGFTCTPRQQRIDDFRNYLAELVPFVRDVYIPDAETVAAKYGDYFSYGRGPGNLLSYGVFDLDATGSTKLLARGSVSNGSRTPQSLDVNSITEDVTYSWFNDIGNGKNPSVGETEALSPKTDAYSWLKAPRYTEAPHEVGPLARMWVNGDYRNGISVMDRHVARALEAIKVAEAMQTWIDEIDPAGAVYNAPTLPATASAYGLTEAPRGALGHWLDISGGTLSRYQVISPTTWNCSPRDSNGLPGPLEDALLGTPVQNADEPIEVMRVIHSFDPCLDCAAHVMRPGKKAVVFRVGTI